MNCDLEFFDWREGEGALLPGVDDPQGSVREGLFVVRITHRSGRRTATPPTLLLEPLTRLFMSGSLRTGTAGASLFELRNPFVDPPVGGVDPDRGHLHDGSMIRYWELAGSTLRDLWKERSETVQYQEWAIGTCRRPFRRIEAADGMLRRVELWDSERLFSEVSNILAASIFYGETGEHLLVFRDVELADELRATLGIG